VSDADRLRGHGGGGAKFCLSLVAVAAARIIANHRFADRPSTQLKQRKGLFGREN